MRDLTPACSSLTQHQTFLPAHKIINAPEYNPDFTTMKYTSNILGLATLTVMWAAPSSMATSANQVAGDQLEAKYHNEAYFLPEEEQEQEQDTHFINLHPQEGQEDEQRVWVTYRNGEHNRLLGVLDSFKQQRYNLKGSRSRNTPSLRLHFDFERINSMVITATQQEIDLLQANPAVLTIEQDQKRFLQYMPETVRHLQFLPTGQRTPYGISMVQADQAWNAGITGAGVKVCVLDTGLDRFHEDFVSNRLDGQETVQNWRQDGVGHGTHVSGTIAAAENDLGVVGVAPDAELYTIKVFGDSGQFVYSSGLVDASYQCQAAGANIVSMSLGGPLPSFAEFGAYEDLFDQGVLVIAAAGNNGSRRKSFPASYNGVMSVAALDRNKDIAPFSQYNDKVDIAAPGVDVLSTLPMDGECQICESLNTEAYGSISGTSMATPHVSGVAALLWSFKPEATVEEIQEAIFASAQDLGANGRDNSYGYGLVQAMTAIEILNRGAL